MISTNSFRKFKPIIFLAIIAPSFIWLFQLINGSLGVNPIEKLMDNLGEMGLRRDELVEKLGIWGGWV